VELLGGDVWIFACRSGEKLLATGLIPTTNDWKDRASLGGLRAYDGRPFFFPSHIPTT
jgi:hypothetical protein